MVKTTIGYIWENDKIAPIFNVIAKIVPSPRIRITGFNDGIISVEPYENCKISKLVEIICGCFNEGSNFFAKILEAYDYDPNATTVNGIKFEYNDVSIVVTQENADVGHIMRQLNLEES